MNLYIADDEQMRALGGALSAAAPPSCVIYLLGELGAGKTTLARGFLQALGHVGAVRSPTYTLVEQYDLSGHHVYHLDLYRLTDPEELEFLGIRDWLEQDAILLVEWPHRGAGILPPADLVIEIVYEGQGRRVRITPVSESGNEIVRRLSDNYSLK
jgi:tRNA threonylcarbamoyladenosine biosynthesis protein TsaE